MTVLYPAVLRDVAAKLPTGLALCSAFAKVGNHASMKKHTRELLEGQYNYDGGDDMDTSGNLE